MQIQQSTSQSLLAWEKVPVCMSLQVGIRNYSLLLWKRLENLSFYWFISILVESYLGHSNFMIFHCNSHSSHISKITPFFAQGDRIDYQATRSLWSIGCTKYKQMVNVIWNALWCHNPGWQSINSRIYW